MRSAGINDPIPGIGAGESAAIRIALEIRADAILADDRRGIREATIRGLNSLTTFALLEKASDAGLINFAESVAALASTTFRMPPEHIINTFLERNRQK